MGVRWVQEPDIVHSVLGHSLILLADQGAACCIQPSHPCLFHWLIRRCCRRCVIDRGNSTSPRSKSAAWLRTSAMRLTICMWIGIRIGSPAVSGSAFRRAWYRWRISILTDGRSRKRSRHQTILLLGQYVLRLLHIQGYLLCVRIALSDHGLSLSLTGFSLYPSGLP